MKKGVQLAICTLLAVAAVGGVRAAYDLDPVVVTAQRTERKDLEIPAAVSVVTAEDMDASGARNVYEALKYTPGVYFNSFGAGGIDFGNHDTKLNMRGVERGAVILLNGMPIASNGTSPLSSIDKSTIAKIEVVKGAGSVLYGPEAMAGVVNIITKEANDPQINVELGYGSHGNKDAHVQFSTKTFSVGYTKEWIGPMSPTTPITAASMMGKRPQMPSGKTMGSSKATADKKMGMAMRGNAGKKMSGKPSSGGTAAPATPATPGGKRPSMPSLASTYGHRQASTRENFFANWHPNENWSVMYNHSETTSVWGRTSLAKDPKKRAAASYDGVWNIKNNYLTAAYHHEGLKANVFYADRKRHYVSHYYDGRNEASASNYQSNRYGIDIQNEWSVRANQDSFILGTMVEKEKYRGLSNANAHDREDRTQYGVYGQYTWNINPQYTQIFGLRYHHTHDGIKSHQVWLPQWQQLYRLSDHEVLYTNIGKSFQLPKLSDYFRTQVAHNLKPETGWNYEVGYKAKWEKDSLRLAAFYIHLDNKIKVSRQPGQDPIVRNLGEFKNKGIEAEWGHQINENWHWNLGVSYSDPQSQELKGLPWIRPFPKLQVTSGIQFHKDAWDASLFGVFAGQRPYGISPFEELSLHVGYRVTENDALSLDVYNILNRRNISRDSDSSLYYTDPRTIMLRYRHTFA